MIFRKMWVVIIIIKRLENIFLNFYYWVSGQGKGLKANSRLVVMASWLEERASLNCLFRFELAINFIKSTLLVSSFPLLKIQFT